MRIEWNKVTWYSKLAAVIVFVVTLFVGVSIGMMYQTLIDDERSLDVGRILLDSSTPSAEGEHCGGFIKNAPTCPVGYHCVLGAIPDTGGVCAAD